MKLHPKTIHMAYQTIEEKKRQLYI